MINMKTIHFLICFCSCINIILAYADYPDYNETDIENTYAATAALVAAIWKPDFNAMANEFEMKFIPISNTVQLKINDVYNLSSNQLREMEVNAEGINADFDECKNNIAIPEMTELYENYKQKCVEPISALGTSILSIGYNKQQNVFYKKYNQLMDTFVSCLRPGDPTPGPRYCAGIMLSTNYEVKRLLPQVRAYGLEINNQLNQEILHLSECANSEISTSSQRIQTEFAKAKECMINKINVAEI